MFNMPRPFTIGQFARCPACYHWGILHLIQLHQHVHLLPGQCKLSDCGLTMTRGSWMIIFPIFLAHNGTCTIEDISSVTEVVDGVSRCWGVFRIPRISTIGQFFRCFTSYHCWMKNDIVIIKTWRRSGFSKGAIQLMEKRGWS